MKQLGVEYLVSVSSAGSMKEELKPGDLIVPDQFIDRTFKRPSSFFGNGIVVHVSLADPVCGELGRALGGGGARGEQASGVKSGNSLAGSIGIISSQPYAILKHIRLINVLTTAAVVVGLYKGATTTSLSTQAFAFSSVSIPASSYVDWYGQARVETADYINLVANLATSTIIQIDGEIGIC